MKGFILTSVHEPGRKQNVESILQKLPAIERVEAVYPAFMHVPFLDRIKRTSAQRTGHELGNGEVGCLLSHRNIWRMLIDQATGEEECFLVMESDSHLCDPLLLEKQFTTIAANYDLFFWGAWEGHMQLLRSKARQLDATHKIGEPFIKTVYCTYGYSLNRKAARYLLDRTRTVHYPVDQFKRFIEPGKLRIGGIVPELISTLDMASTIRQPGTKGVANIIFRKILDIKNSIICFLR